MNSIDPGFQSLLYFKNEQYREVFCKLPVVLLTNAKYAKLTNNARVAYAVLISRFELSYKNNWIDEAGAIYFYYTTKNMADDIHVSERTAVKVRQELVSANLLNIQKQGMHKPSRLYLLKPQIDTTDFDKIDTLKNRDIAPTEPQRNVKGQLTSDAKSAPLDKNPANQHLDSRDANFASLKVQNLPGRYNNNQIKHLEPNPDPKKTDTLNTDSIRSEKLSTDAPSVDKILAQYKDLDNHQALFSPTAFNLLHVLAQSYQHDFDALQQLIFKAKDQAFHNYGLYSKSVDLANFPRTVEKTLYRILKQIKTGKIKQIDRYLFKTFAHEFDLLAQKYVVWTRDHHAEGQSSQPPLNVTEADLEDITVDELKDLFG